MGLRKNFDRDNGIERLSETFFDYFVNGLITEGVVSVYRR